MMARSHSEISGLRLNSVAGKSFIGSAKQPLGNSLQVGIVRRAGGRELNERGILASVDMARETLRCAG